jgi:hypothetical protein
LTTEIIKNIARFLILILAQVLVVQNINLSGYIILLPYVLIILMLPFETNRIVVLIAAFIAGVTIDYFYDSSGIHASACTIMGFSRHYVLRIIAPRDGYEVGLKPTVHNMGLEWFLSYAGILIFVHHFFLFYLEIFRFTEFFRTLLRVVLSSAATLGLIYLIQLLFFTGTRRST